MLDDSEIGDVSPVVVPASVSVCAALYALENVHQEPEVADDNAGNVKVLDGPAVKRYVVPTRFDDAVKFTVVPDTLDVAYRYDRGARTVNAVLVFSVYSEFSNGRMPPSPESGVSLRI